MNIQMLANNKRDVIDCLSEFKDNYADVMIWDKGNGAPAMAKNVVNASFEFVFIFSREKGASRAITSGNEFRGTIKNVYAGPPQRDNEFSDVHAATFPLHLPAFFIEHFSKDSVLDLFGGTGTTMIAAEQLGRKAYLMELDPRYCDVIIARWEKFTGRTAEKICES
jgi:DNA modification methylase